MKEKKIAYSILELAIVPHDGSMKDTLNNSAKLAKLAEANGYERIWLAEHHNSAYIGSNAPPLLIGYIAENTNTIRVGSGGVMLPNHSPLIIAEQFGTLAQLYPGRIDLGLGRAPGTDPETTQAIRADHTRAAHLFPDEVRKIQTYFSKENANSKVRAAIAEGTDVPLYILGSSTDSAHLAAEKGLPYAFASHFASTHLQNALEIYRNEFRPSAYLQKPYVMAGVNIFVADTNEEAEQLYTTLIRMFLSVLTGRPEGLRSPVKLSDELQDVARHPAVEQMLKYTFFGDKGKVKAEVTSFLEQTGADELITVTPTYAFSDRARSLKLFAEIMRDISNA